MQADEKKNLISVIIEGYNDSLALGNVEETIAALRNQDFQVERVEVILVGSVAQARGWKEVYADDRSFFAIKTVGVDNAHYYQLKNVGVELATADILAFTDSDVVPEKNWLSVIYDGIANYEAGAVAGMSLFRHRTKLLASENPVMLTAASISWGFVVPKQCDQERVSPNAFLSHNLGIRKSVFDEHFYREDLGRTCAGNFLFNTLVDSGARFHFQAEQRVAHNFSFWWWLTRINFRSGYEIYTLRRIDPKYPNKFLTRLSAAEPVVSFFWNVMLDVPRWFRFSGFLGFSPSRQFVYVPLVICLSSCARLAESIGMFATMLFKEPMRRYAEET